jgi:ADP-heptose:LPS heptosyltransferase
MRLHPIDAMLYLFVRLCKTMDRRNTDLSCIDTKNVERILVVSSSAIGDTLLSTPAIRAVREHFTRARIIALFNRDNMELFENNPHIDGIVPFHGGYKRFLRTIWRLRKHNFDLALIFHGNEPQATPMAYLSGARYIIKLPNANEYRFLLSNREPVSTWGDFTQAVEHRLLVAELAGCQAGDRRMVLPLATDQETPVEKFFQSKGIVPSVPLVGFQVAASTVSRMWFAEKFIELGRQLTAQYPDIRIVITGSPQEAGYAGEIAAAIGSKVIVAAGVLRLKQVPGLVRRFKLVVTGDTGIMHLAIAVGTPVVALYAAADARMTGPYYDNDRHTIIQKHRTCDPCLGKKCPFQWCMVNISVEEVLSAVVKTLNMPASFQVKSAATVSRND